MTSFVLFLTLSASVARAAEAPPSRFAEANALYQDGKYTEAAKIYGEIAASRKSTAVFYNLANACFRSGQKGRALLFYERALRIAPRDPDIIWNLQILRNALPDRIEPPPEDILLSFIKRTAARFTMDEMSLSLTLVLALSAGVVCLVWLFPGSRRLGRAFTILFLLLLALNGAFIVLKWLDVKDSIVVVLEKEVTARYGPSTRETQAFVLHEGAEGRITDQTGEWLYIRLANGNTGWIPRQSCETV